MEHTISMKKILFYPDPKAKRTSLLLKRLGSVEQTQATTFPHRAEYIRPHLQSAWLVIFIQISVEKYTVVTGGQLKVETIRGCVTYFQLHNILHICISSGTQTVQ